MRFGAVSTITLFAAAGMLACAGNTLNESTSGSGGAAGGTSSSGGAKSSGGTTSESGGSSSSGGASSSGGMTSSGGASASGGTTSSGGATSSGGVTARGGSGGASGSTSSSGGANSAGGSSARGGSSGTTPSAGGSTGTCTDTAPADNPCSSWKSWGQCSTSYLVDGNYCNLTCGRCGSGSTGSGGASANGGASGTGSTTSMGGTSGGGGVSGPGTTNPQITGTNGWATRYWDCCKPSCGWTANSNPAVPSCAKDGTTRVGVDAKNGCEGGGSAFECYDFSPWYDAGTNMAYGFAAYNGVSCGTCFKLQFTGSGHSGVNDGAAALKGQQMVVQVINIGGIEANQFDVLIPGGGVGAMNGCATQWGSSTDLGSQYGGLLSECNGDATCMKGKCASVFGNVSSVLKAGCDWFTGWYSSADNPALVYTKVSCPSQLSGKTGLSK